MEEIVTGNAVTKIGYHFVWCTKYKKKILNGIIEIELKRILGQTCAHYGWSIEDIKTMPDHVHIYIQCDHTVAPVQICQTLKSLSAVHLFSKFSSLKGAKFWGSGLWAKGCYYASVGHISEPTIQQYINSQKSK